MKERKEAKERSRQQRLKLGKRESKRGRMCTRARENEAEEKKVIKAEGNIGK